MGSIFMKAFIKLGDGKCVSLLFNVYIRRRKVEMKGSAMFIGS